MNHGRESRMNVQKQCHNASACPLKARAPLDAWILRGFTGGITAFTGKSRVRCRRVVELRVSCELSGL